VTDDDEPVAPGLSYGKMRYDRRTPDQVARYNKNKNDKKKEDRRVAAGIRKEASELDDSDTHSDVSDEEHARKSANLGKGKMADKDFDVQLRILEKRTRGNPTDADGDIDFAYRNMALPNVTPLMASSMAAWSWYLYSRTEPNKFLEICAKREDAKAKLAGAITSQRMADDRRAQFEVIERLEKSLTQDVTAIVKELMEKYPLDVLTECRKHQVEWDKFLAQEKTP